MATMKKPRKPVKNRSENNRFIGYESLKASILWYASTSDEYTAACRRAAKRARI